jgi:hypothetical protein
MQKTGIASLPLHGGKAPRWLFKRMVALSKQLTRVIVYEYGSTEFLRRVSDPYWFQALSCVLGYDWHSSGTTTVTCGALKEAINSEGLGITFCGGKGKTARNTLHEIQACAENYNHTTSLIDRLKYCSRMTAKIDNTAIQDGHCLYHHVFIVTEDKKWAVIQQGMNDVTGYARRYHWLSEKVHNFVCDPNNSIVGDDRLELVLNMTAQQSVDAQKISVELINDHPNHLQHDWANLIRNPKQKTLDDWSSESFQNTRKKILDMPRFINWEKMKHIYDVHPTNYEELLALRGVGPSTIRALALISELVYGQSPSWDDPVRFSFTVGGKDGVPYPVDRKAMDESAEMLRVGIEQACIGDKEKIHALRRLKDFLPRCSA